MHKLNLLSVVEKFGRLWLMLLC